MEVDPSEVLIGVLTRDSEHVEKIRSSNLAESPDVAIHLREDGISFDTRFELNILKVDG